MCAASRFDGSMGDEIWSFIVCKKTKNASLRNEKSEGWGDIWTWIAMDADTKLVVTYLGRRQGQALGLQLHGRLARKRMSAIRPNHDRCSCALPESGGSGVRRGDADYDNDCRNLRRCFG